ncbi:efflux RND transporter periplasmic adaptor subunit [Shewanella psychromarinicola]|uniref:Efflux RND transporter periplasmic adaptor subunit n=1 Tax=Shewanella psychromarinicola TaxID=2487742 RepID=A0A3N4DRT9_9GAMM|nr:efflux RND transporter periplasmic adaptor subunit [Shewanella psychromarinicola]AZG36255.1 efflux RND transporter periplasmic adaptor subunit [Shewanella psychromarinicola]MCL1082167.1 efflux RND transporter periplasmic adaptor subunit [Shewanella psychromarinicola]RPA27352.1 efflux RND transporter periplasmic adaptor subunit [Shewanella psychromarinicola]
MNTFSLPRSLLIVSLLLLLSACNDAAITQVAAPAPHVVEIIKEIDIVPEMAFIGRTEATEDVSLRAQVEGVLLKRHFTGGDDVEAGDLLFEIDATPYNTEVNQQKASLKHAQSAYKIAKNRWQRGQKLINTGAISELDIDELTASMNQTESDVAIKQAYLDNALLNLSYTKIMAPISGRISRSKVSTGDLITANNLELATLVQLDPIWVNFQIPEKTLTKARKEFTDGLTVDTDDLTATINLSDTLDYPHTGKIDFIDNRIDQSTGTLAIRAIFINPKASLLPGQYTKLSLAMPHEEKIVVISQSAVQEEQQGRFVLVVNEENKIEKRMVKLGARYDVRWEVINGLKLGEKIVVEGLQKVRVGIVVETTEQTETPFASKNEK